jgi:NADH:ubiquinone oxidoreductase subunit 6 (subunit J)
MNSLPAVVTGREAARFEVAGGRPAQYRSVHRVGGIVARALRWCGDVMHTWTFWGLAAAAIASSVLVVGLRHAVPSARALLALSVALAGLSMLLAAPGVAVVLLIAPAAGATILLRPVPPLDGPDVGRVPGTSIGRRLGLLVAVVLVVELGWAFRQTHGVRLPAQSSDLFTSAVNVAGAVWTDHLATLAAAALLLVVSVAGVAAVRREER